MITWLQTHLYLTTKSKLVTTLPQYLFCPLGVKMDSVDKFIHSNYAFHVTQGKLKPHVFELD